MGVPINLMGVLESLASENSPYAHSKLETSEELQPSKPQKSKKKKKKHKSFVEPENEIKVEVLETYFEDIKMVRKLLVSLDDVLDDLGEKYVEQIEAVSNRVITYLCLCDMLLIVLLILIALLLYANGDSAINVDVVDIV
eukprot:TRINITY_DN5469_c0_g2_i1.p1 TRINITY_DN5469_c0_g2~~TRINITY_DN5469_c0_g2_i1.p1  ORF type:complete len:140 (-),score=34.61 TRINITY_DN5469_c0_g2_i1:4-423(-)